ncbi:cupin domain-containing protein [Clostridium tagluense]|uniref:Cupin n=1 Tax=Clostridium tagluense TaxID=360422 RepID=A0A401UL64_9CLOT|nr:cupin domain-containing protein [Clostridium tagluense]GCD10212.1 cupin [Clostridium tagluense]
MNGKFFKNIEVATALGLKEEVLYVEKQVVSKTLTQTNNVSITLFAFDKGEEISTHSAPGDALVYVTEGEVTITIGDNDPVIVKEGEIILMPANIPHGLEANERFKMMLVIVKG